MDSKHFLDKNLSNVSSCIGRCSRSVIGTGAYNAMRSEEYVDGSVWQPQASHYYFYFVGKCDVLARGLHGSSNLY